MIQANENLVAEGTSMGAQTNGSRTPTFVVCPHMLLREALGSLLTGTRFVIGESSADGHFETASPAEPTLCIVAHSHCSDETVAIVRHLREWSPMAKVCVLADRFETGALLAACAAGADSFCLTTAPREALIGSLELAMLGVTVVPSSEVHQMLDHMGRSIDEAGQGGARDQSPVKVPGHKLSTREGEVLRCLMEGSPNKVIARQFGLTEATVKVHVKAILRKIGAKNRTQAAMWATDFIGPSPRDVVAGDRSHLSA